MSHKSMPKRRRKAPPSASQYNHRTARAAMLDRLADAELQHGHHAAAERLAWRAAELRLPSHLSRHIVPSARDVQ
jgi:hypothetical protein